MPKTISQKLSLDQPATYQIEVPGMLDSSWLDWDSDMMVTVRGAETNSPVSTLTGIFDQAALQGLLRRLYSLGIPLVSVICLDLDWHTDQDGQDETTR